MKVSIPFTHQKTHICEEARQMLRQAGFTLVCNETGRRLTFEEQREMISGAFAVIAGTERYDAAMLEGLDSLRVIVRFGVGVDNFDVPLLKRMGVQIGVISNYNAVAEFTLLLILSAMKNLPRLDREVRQGRWSRYPMRELRGKTVGLVGFGRIGQRVAELLTGFDARLLAYDPYIDAEKARQRGVVPVPFETLLRESDVVSLHLPANEKTFHLMNERTLSMMKEGAVLVNTARGMLVDEEALMRALSSGRLCAAGLDVYEKEPITAPDNPLLQMEQTTLTPHTAAITLETNYNGGLICAESILNVLRGGQVVYPV